MRFRVDRPWALAAVAGLLYCASIVLAYHGLHAIVALAGGLLTLAALLALVDARYRAHAPIILFVAVIGFPEYGPDPYLPNFVAPFSFAKYACALCFGAMCRPAVTRGGIALAAIVGISGFMAATAGRVGDIGAEAWYAVLLLVALNAHARLEVVGRLGTIVLACERVFYMLPVMAAATFFLGVYDVRAGNTYVHFYGHWIGIVSAVAFYQLLSGSSTVLGAVLPRMAAVLVTLYAVHTSYQSAHFVLLMIAAAVGVRAAIKTRARRTSWAIPLVGIGVAATLGAYAVLTGEAGTWVYLKVTQVAELFAGDFVDASNSVVIRVSELISVLEQGSWVNVLFGRGLGSTYVPRGALWESAVFHDATFPERELVSGDLQYIHEPLVMILKWAGIIGVLLAAYEVIRRAKASPRGLAALIAVTYLLYFASTLQTGLFVTAFYVLTVRSRGTECADA
jgi:hypothetical protein